MIKFLRAKANQRKIFIGMAALIIPSFVIWGVVTEKDENSPGALAGQLEKKKITTGDFIRNYEALRREILLLHGEEGARQAGRADLEKATWDRILILDYARKKGVRVSNADVVAWIGRQTVFLSPSGHFNQEYYERFVEKSLRISAREFEEEMRNFLTVQETIRLLATVEPPTEDEAKKTYLERRAKRDISYVLVTTGLQDAQGAEDLKVNDEETRQIFDLLKDRLTKPERVNVSYVFFEDLGSKKEEIQKALLEGGLEKSSEFGLDIKESGFVTRQDALPQAGFSEQITEALFALKNPGDITPWIETEKGAVIAKLISRVQESQMNYEEARSAIETRILQSKKQEALRSTADAIRNEITETGFQETAAAKKLEIHEAKGFSSSDYLDKAGVLDGFGTYVAPLKASDISQPIPIPDGFLIMKVLSVDETIGEDWAKEKDGLIQELSRRAEIAKFETEMKALWQPLRVESKTMESLFPNRGSTSSEGPLTPT